MLVAIIFMWTPPHFWALSLWRSDDYARAGVPMLPVVQGKPDTRRQILLYTLLLVAGGFAPRCSGFGGHFIWRLGPSASGSWFKASELRVNAMTEREPRRAACSAFRCSICLRCSRPSDGAAVRDCAVSAPGREDER